ncbi:MAG: class I SAM-dependent methyltransferase [Bacteroidota bacterium]|nr:class I SAM-dependent methyltransferase [Bacteroidota bacterium]
MRTEERRSHWERIYNTKQPNEVSWYQSEPTVSLDLIKQLDLPKSAKIFDNGGGDSYLVDNLLKLGFENITVQDISEAALDKAKKRLKKDAEKIKWVVCDEAHCNPPEQYDLWHDRAAFHFLTEEDEIKNYINTISKSIKPDGYFIIATFSEQGPLKCSGLFIKQYSQGSMTTLLENSFEKEICFTTDHHTPFNTTQNFLFCTFKRKHDGLPPG